MHSSVPESSSAAESTSGLSTLDLVVEQYQSKLPRGENFPPPPAMSTTAIGRLVGFDDNGQALVKLPGDDFAKLVAARATLQLCPTQIDSEVVLIFVGDDREKPIIIGCLQATVPHAAEAGPPQVELNGQRLELTARDEIVLRCGKSSITLTQAGKVIIRGEYLLSRSSGVNRIKGGSVQIN